MRHLNTMGTRRFGAVNWIGFRALYAREVRRFASIYSQTVVAPTLTSGLFMLVFLLAFGERRGDVPASPAARDDPACTHASKPRGEATPTVRTSAFAARPS